MSADSVDRKSKNKVVATLPKSPTLGVSTYSWQPEDAPMTADAREGWLMPRIQDEAGRGRFNYNTATPGQILDFETKYKINTPVVPLVAQLPGGGMGGGYGGSGSGSGSGSGNDAMMNAIKQYGRAGEASAWENYNNGINNINAGYDTAQRMVDSGYGDLNKYLTTNQVNPYAGLQQAVSPVNNAMANYLSAYGVSNDPVTQQVQASQIAGQQSADSFNQLQQLMSANQLSNNQSNIDVAKMAQNYATTGLGTQRAGYQANAETARSAAMSDLMEQILKAKIDAYK